jgi:hypothetical protein
MNRTTGHKWKENGHALACPYCSAGTYWDFQDCCWLCIICGYREYEQALRLRSMIEIVAEKVWDEIFDHLPALDSNR